jgi:hypothetical protein
MSRIPIYVRTVAVIAGPVTVTGRGCGGVRSYGHTRVPHMAERRVTVKVTEVLG